MNKPLLPLTILLLGLGCGGEEEAQPATAPTGTMEPVAWQAKLRAASDIRQVEIRDAAMADLAVQAAGAGQWGTLLPALDSIQAVEVHDEAARTSAVALARFGRLDYARQVAGRIRNTGIRDDALRQVSQVR